MRRDNGKLGILKQIKKNFRLGVLIYYVVLSLSCFIWSLCQTSVSYLVVYFMIFKLVVVGLEREITEVPI
jgi:hypothetical protein